MACEKTLPIALEIFPNMVSGDDTNASLNIVIDDTETALVSVAIRVKSDPESATADLELTSTAGDIIINSTAAGNWDFIIPNVTVTLDAGDYQVHLTTTDSEGARLTYFYQDNWRITLSI